MSLLILTMPTMFPKNFIISLPRPAGYMGVSDFYDFDQTYDAEDYAGNQNAFVRGVFGEDEQLDNLPKAIDAFVLAGAIKLYRQERDPANFSYRHHTMLVHHAAQQIVHDEEAERVRTLFGEGRRYMTKEGRKSLADLFDKDFARVSATRCPNAPMPKTFADLERYVSQCVARINQEKSVLIVNGENECEHAGFRPNLCMGDSGRRNQAISWIHLGGLDDVLLQKSRRCRRHPHANGPLVWLSSRFCRPRSPIHRKKGKERKDFY